MAFFTHTVAAQVPVEPTRNDVRRMLVDWRRELLNEIQSKIRDVREEGCGHYHQTADLGDTPEVDSEDDLAFALIHMKTQVLNRINEAVRRIDEGTYGYCMDCADAIAALRLRALPFAVRCRDCEETREQSVRRVRIRARHLASDVSLDMEH
jgi:DnaK suppressor protein